MGRLFLWLCGTVAVVAGIVALGVGMGTRPDADAILMAICPLSLICGLLFLVLAARQSRLDKEAKEAQRHRDLIEAARK